MARTRRKTLPGRTGKSKRSKQPRPESHYRAHPLFGNVPLVPIETIGADGKSYRYLTYDLAWSPELPKGAVRGDVRRQQFCPACHMPRYFYVDDERTCVQCGRQFVFSAAEQKYWYESLQFHFDSVAIRCPECRRKQRTQRALNAQIAAARNRLRSNPVDPSHLLNLAEALVRYHERTGSGNLDEAIAASRLAVRQARRTSWGGTAEAYFWEASAQRLAGRTREARALYERFLESVPDNRKYGPLVAEARGYLAAG